MTNFTYDLMPTKITKWMVIPKRPPKSKTKRIAIVRVCVGAVTLGHHPRDQPRQDRGLIPRHMNVMPELYHPATTHVSVLARFGDRTQVTWRSCSRQTTRPYLSSDVQVELWSPQHVACAVQTRIWTHHLWHRRPCARAHVHSIAVKRIWFTTVQN